MQRGDRMCVTCKALVSNDGFSIMPCQHVFCRNCARQYVVNEIKQGTQPLTCLKHGCKSEIDDVMVLSLVPFSLYRTWARIQRERTVMSIGRWKRCPKENCSHIVSVSERSTNDVENPSPKTLSSRQEVTCVCKSQFCVDCQGTPHWPATCNQATVYHEITQHVLGSVNEKTIIKVNSCPRCREKINKDGGHRGRLMTCRCGSYVCWACLRPLTEHKVGDICQNITGEDIEFSNRMVLNLPTHNIESAISYLLMQKRLITWKKSRVHLFSTSMLPACSDDVPHGPKINSRVKHKTDAFHNLTLFIKVYITG
uniref:RBR-type E3 ubiquitin transferase n=1 Tax=Crassostrea virginica TaxID=6565 RepID=A0A8B8BJ90_CRAVI|nr:probable E3 ubiquitin-protein ligase ARI3 [Crassostrea virginica]